MRSRSPEPLKSRGGPAEALRLAPFVGGPIPAERIGAGVAVPAHREKVLVVDDDDQILHLLAPLLSSLGFDVVVASAGDEALRKAAAGGFDLVVTDLSMPGMDGLEVLKGIKEIDPDVEVIVMTGYSSVDSAIECLRRGAYDYVQKPIDRREIGALAQQAMEKRRLRGMVSLLEASRELFRTLSLDDLLPRVLDLAARVVRHDGAAILCASNGPGAPSFLSRGPIAAPTLTALRARMEAAFDGLGPLREEIPEAGPSCASAVLFPLALRGTSLGALALLRGPEGRAFATGEIQRGEIFATEVSVALDNVRLYRQVHEKMNELIETRAQLIASEKLAVAGRLAAGIAHEINTPIQFVGDSIHFLRDAFAELQGLLRAYRGLKEAAAGGAVASVVMSGIESAEAAADVAYLEEQIPKAIDRTLEGTGRVAGIVRAMKEFAHPDRKEKAPADLNRALQSTLTVARNELKYVAEVVTEFGDLPPVMCHLGDLNQVFLNLLVNAAHAIGEVVGKSGKKGTITVRTRQEGDSVVVSIADTGCGIPEANRTKVFEPFFTTKEVGKGTGQGLAIARSIVVEKHGGSLEFESEVGRGTTFRIRLPIHLETESAPRGGA